MDSLAASRDEAVWLYRSCARPPLLEELVELTLCPVVVGMETTAQLLNMQQSEVRSDQDVLVCFDASESLSAVSAGRRSAISHCGSL